MFLKLSTVLFSQAISLPKNFILKSTAQTKHLIFLLVSSALSVFVFSFSISTLNNMFIAVELVVLSPMKMFLDRGNLYLCFSFLIVPKWWWNRLVCFKVHKKNSLPEKFVVTIFFSCLENDKKFCAQKKRKLMNNRRRKIEQKKEIGHWLRKN